MSDYLHGDAGDEICREIEEHLRGCENCRIYIDNMKLLIRLYKPWKDDGIPDDVLIRLRSAIAEETGRRASGKPARKSAAKTSTKSARKSTGKAARKSSAKKPRGSAKKSAGRTSKKKR